MDEQFLGETCQIVMRRRDKETGKEREREKMI